MTKIKDLLARFTALFSEAGVDSPRLSAELLMALALGLDRAELLKQLILQPGLTIEGNPLQKAEALAARRLTGEPAAFLSGEKEFYGRPFKVSPATLIPRPESELLVDLAVEYARKRQIKSGHFADLGTGTGCLAVTLALELPGWQGLGLDIVPQAVDLARQNAARLGAEKRLDLQEADFMQMEPQPQSLDLLVSNPPYISEDEFAALSPEVRNFEPVTALLSGPQGLEHPLRVIWLAERALKPGGLLLMETGCQQGKILAEKFQNHPAWANVEIVKDLAGLDRVFKAERR